MKKIAVIILGLCACVTLVACATQTVEKDYEGFEGVLDFGAYSGVAPLNDDEIEEFNRELADEGLVSYWYHLDNWDQSVSPTEVYFGYIDKMEERGFTSSYDREQEEMVIANLSNESFLITTSWSPRTEEVGVLIGPMH